MPTSSISEANIPIIGQQLAVEGYTIALSARCACDKGGTLVPLTITVGPSGTIAPQNACSKCKLGYEVQGVQMDTHGRLTFAIAILSAVPEES